MSARAARIARRVALVLPLGWATMRCDRSPGRESPPETTVLGRLPAGVAAQVGRFDVTWDEVRSVAREQAMSAAAARDALVRDALFAEGAAERGLDRAVPTRTAIRSFLARSALEELATASRLAPPTDAEVGELTEAHFFELDRPEAFRVIHAVARADPKDDPEQKRRARAVAESIARVVAGASDASSFRAKAESVPHPSVQVLVEELEPVAADGRVVDQASAREGRTFDPDFSAAAARLSRPGDQSGVVETAFGYHVLMLLERIPEHRVPLEERRALLRDEIVTRRCKQAADRLVQRLKTEHPVMVERTADALLAGIGVGAPARSP